MPTTVSILSIRVGAKHQLDERTRVVVGRGGVLPHATPPEDVLEVVQASPHLLQRRAAEIEEDVRVPARDLGGPLVFRVAAMRAEHRQLRKPPGDLLEVHGPHAGRRHVLGLVEHFAQYDAGVKEDDPRVVVGQLVDRVDQRSTNGFLGNSSSPRPRYPRSCSSLTCWAASGASSSTKPNGTIFVGCLRAASATTLR